ncbi:MAG: hypothetical protein ACFFD7_05105 [Candidatus Thorarchaeota archaeon]
MQKLKDECLTQAKKFMREGKLDEALPRLNEFGEKKSLSFHDQISYYILKSSLSLYFFQMKELLNYAEKAYHESQNLGNSLQLLDVYIQMAMALSYWYKPEESFKFVEKAEDLLKVLSEEPPTELMERKASILHIKGWFYHDKDEKDRALKYAQQSLQIREEYELKVDIGISLWQIGWIHFLDDNILALQYADQCIEYCKKIDYKKLIQRCTWLKGRIYLTKGELNQALESIKHCKILFEELPEEMKDKRGFAQLLHLIGSVYLEKNDLYRAKKYLEKALKIKTEIGNNTMIVITLDSLISLTLDQSDLKSAENYLKDLKRISDLEGNKLANLVYRQSMAKLLKLSPLDSDQAKAEEMLKETLEDKLADDIDKIIAMLNLCNLLLGKLQKSSDLKLLDEIQLYITQILYIAKNQKFYSFLAETHLLQAKLELLMLKMKEAQQFLDQAHEIAENYGLNQLAIRIIDEQYELSNNFMKWEKFKASGAKISEYMDLALIEEQIEILLQKRNYLKILTTKRG